MLTEQTGPNVVLFGARVLPEDRAVGWVLIVVGAPAAAAAVEMPVLGMHEATGKMLAGLSGRLSE